MIIRGVPTVIINTTGGLGFYTIDPDRPDEDKTQVQLETPVVPMRMYTGSKFNWRSWDSFSRVGIDVPPDDDPPEDQTRFCAGVFRPQFAPAGGLLFYLDDQGHLWKFDGEKYWEIGLEYESFFSAYRPLNASGQPSVQTSQATVIHATAELVTDPITSLPTLPDYTEPTETDPAIITVTIKNLVELEGFEHGEGYGEIWDASYIAPYIMWIWGYPFRIIDASAPDEHSGEILCYLEVNDYSKNFWFEWEDFYGGELRAGFADPSVIYTMYPSKVYLTHDYENEWCDWCFDDRTANPDGERHKGLLDGSYQYVMTLTTKHGYESNPCQEVSLDLNEEIAKINYCDITTGDGDRKGTELLFSDGYIKNINIYRTCANKPGVYYLHSVIPYTWTFSWSVFNDPITNSRNILFDNKEDSALGEALHPLKLTPRSGTCICSTKNTLILADGTGVYVSEVGDPETFYTYLSFESPILALASIPNFDNFIVFMRDRIYSVNIFDYSTTLLAHGVGISGRDALCVMNDRIVFQASGGQIYQYTGTSVSPIPGHEKIDDLLQGRSPKRMINTSQFAHTFMFYSQARQECWAIIGEDTQLGNLVLVISQTKPVFTLYKFQTDAVITCASCFQDGGQEIILLGMDDGSLWSFNRGAQSDNGLPIPFYLESGEIGLLDEQIRLRRIYADVISDTPTNILVTGRYDSENAVSEGVLKHQANATGDERFLSLYGNKVVRCYQFTMKEESTRRFTMKSFSVIYQPKKERQRWNR